MCSPTSLSRKRLIEAERKKDWADSCRLPQELIDEGSNLEYRDI